MKNTQNAEFPKRVGDICWGTETYKPFCECGDKRKPNVSAGKDAYHNCRLGEIHYKGKYVGGALEFFSARMGARYVGFLVGVTTRQKGYRISRVVVHPTYRGCGIGQRLIKAYVALHPDCDTVAAMARFNPVFERAGMRRVADLEVAPPKEFKDFPLTQFQWTTKEGCQQFLERHPVWYKILVANASKIAADLHPGGVFFATEDELKEYLGSNTQVAARALWKVRPRKLAKYVGPTHV